MRSPASGDWPPPISCVGHLENCADPGCEKCKRCVEMIVRGAKLVWLLRACHGSDKSRTPQCAFWRVVPRSAKRLRIIGRAGKPLPGRAWRRVGLNRRLRSRTRSQSPRWPPAPACGRLPRVSSPPPCPVSRLQGRAERVCPTVPDFPLCAMSPPRDCAKSASKKIEPVPWTHAIGRRRHDSAAWHSPFDTLVPTERVLGPVPRLPLRARASQLGAIPAAEGNPGAAGVASETTLRVIPSPVSAGEVERLSRAYVDFFSRYPCPRLCPCILRFRFPVYTSAASVRLLRTHVGRSPYPPRKVPVSVTLAVCARPELLDMSGHTARLRWFPRRVWVGSIPSTGIARRDGI